MTTDTPTRARKPRTPRPALPTSGFDLGERATTQFPIAMTPTDKHRLHVIGHAMGVPASTWLREVILAAARAKEVELGPATLAASAEVLRQARAGTATR